MNRAEIMRTLAVGALPGPWRHEHRVDADLSAYVAAPCCGCGAFVWDDTGAPKTQPRSVPLVSTDQ